MPEPSYVAGPSDRPLRWITIGDLLDETAARVPDGEALVAVADGVRLTWSGLREEADRAARALLALGVAPGDRVGIWSPNRVEWTIAQYATAKVGAILVNVNPAYRRHELRYALDAAGVSLLITARGFHAADYVAMLDDDRGELASLRSVVLLGEGDLPRWATSWVLFAAGIPVPMSRNWSIPASPARYCTARPRNRRFSTAVTRIVGKTSTIASPEARSAAKLSLPPSQ